MYVYHRHPRFSPPPTHHRLPTITISPPPGTSPQSRYLFLHLCGERCDDHLCWGWSPRPTARAGGRASPVRERGGRRHGAARPTPGQPVLHQADLKGNRRISCGRVGNSWGKRDLYGLVWKQVRNKVGQKKYIGCRTKMSDEGLVRRVCQHARAAQHLEPHSLSIYIFDSFVLAFFFARSDGKKLFLTTRSVPLSQTNKQTKLVNKKKAFLNTC